MLKKFKDFYNNILKNIENKKQQKIIFDEVKTGDMLWCTMPLSKKELRKIEKSHRVRPYLVVAKKADYLLCYQSSSQNKEKLNNYQEYTIKGKRYRSKKDSYIDLTSVKKIKIKNIQSTYIKLNQIDIKNIEKRIRISKYRGNNNLVQFNEPIHLEIGDVVVRGVNYYIYAEDNVNIYGFKVQRKYEQNLEEIIINRKKYYTNFKEFKTINKNDKFDIVNIANEDEIKEIFNKKMAKRLKPDKNIKELLENSNDFEIGTVFKYGRSTIMYVYSDNNKYYGVDLLWYKIKPKVFEIKEPNKRKIVEMKSLEEINNILEFLLEKNINTKKIKKIYQYIRNLLYSSVA